LNKDILWSTDLMVLSIKKDGRNTTITQRIGSVSDYTFSPPENVYTSLNPPKYPSSTAQIDQTTLIKPGDDTYCENGY
jgi:hypothetical protein